MMTSSRALPSQVSPDGKRVGTWAVERSERGNLEDSLSQETEFQRASLRTAIVRPVCPDNLLSAQDDFGEFMDASDTPFDLSIADESLKSTISTEATFAILLEKVIVIPQVFIDALIHLPYPLRQRVLNQDKTKLYIKGMVEGGKLAQRIIHGRHCFQPNGFDSQRLDVTAKRLIDRWNELVPRLRSISGDKLLNIEPLELTKYRPSIFPLNLCSLCHTPVDDHSGAKGMEWHSTCESLHNKFFSTT